MAKTLDLTPNVFAGNNPKRIAASLKHFTRGASDRSTESYQSALSVLNFQISRAGRGMSANRRRVLEQSKFELRKLFRR